MKFNKPLQVFIGGSWQKVKNCQSFDVFNPATGEVCAQVADASLEDVQQAISAASSAKQTWADADLSSLLVNMAGEINKCFVAFIPGFSIGLKPLMEPGHYFYSRFANLPFSLYPRIYC